MHHGQMGGTLGIGQVLIKREQLARRQHTFIYNHFGRQAAGVKHLRFGHRSVTAQLVGKALADHIEAALKVVAAESSGGANKQLGDVRLRHSRGRADICANGVNRHVSPAQQCLPFFGDQCIDGGNASGTLFSDLRQEDVAHGVLAHFGQRETQLSLGELREKSMRQRHENTRAIACVGLETAAATVIHA